MRFVGKYVKGKRKRFRPSKGYIFLIGITCRVELVADSRDSCAAQVYFIWRPHL